MAEAGGRVDFKTDELERAVESARIAALKAGGQVLLESMRPLIPVETGRLRDSGNVEVEGMEVAITFDTPYAARVHEDQTLRHPNGGTDHWIPKGIAAGRDEAMQAVAETLKQESGL